MDVMTWIRQEHSALGPRLHDWFVSEIPQERFTERAGGIGCSAAWLVLHTTVHQDAGVTVAARGLAPVAADHWAHLGLGDLHWSVPLNEPDQLDVHPSVDVRAVLDYADAVNASTAAWLDNLRADELDTVPPTASRLAEAGVVDPAVAWVAQRWAEKPVSWLVQWEAIGHTLLHQGELAALRVRLGLRS
jgi:hypothetical protein